CRSGMEDGHQLRLPGCLGHRRRRSLDDRRVDRPPRRHAVARRVWRGDGIAAVVPDRGHGAVARRRAAAKTGQRAHGRCVLAAGRHGGEYRACVVPPASSRMGIERRLPPTFPDRGPDAWSDSRVVLRVNADGRRLSAGCHGKGEHAMTIARWPALVTPWLGEDDRERERLPPLAPGCMPDALQDTEAIRITGLNDGTVLRPAPNSDKPLRVTLHAIGAQSDVQWLVDGRLLASAPESAAVTLDLGLPGPHRLTAVTHDGAWDSVGFSVTNN